MAIRSRQRKISKSVLARRRRPPTTIAPQLLERRTVSQPITKATSSLERDAMAWNRPMPRRVADLQYTKSIADWVARKPGTIVSRSSRPTLDEVAIAHSELINARTNLRIVKAQIHHQKILEDVVRAGFIPGLAPFDRSTASNALSRIYKPIFPFREGVDPNLFMGHGGPGPVNTSNWYPQAPKEVDEDFEAFRSTGARRSQLPTKDDFPLHLATFEAMGEHYTGSLMHDLFPRL